MVEEEIHAIIKCRKCGIYGFRRSEKTRECRKCRGTIQENIKTTSRGIRERIKDIQNKNKRKNKKML